jgi:alpha-L-rhamnosidase
MNVNMRDAIQDPDRERAQWWGDVVIVLGEILYSCDINAHALIKKAILNLVDWQKPDGVLYSPVPAGSWEQELPGQMLSSIGMHGFWYYYLYTGDIATIKHAYPAVKRYLDLWKPGSDGLLIHRSGGWDWGDWGENIDRPVMDNALLYQALESAVNMAKVTGNEADIPHYESVRKSIRANFNRVLWTGTEYRSPGYTGITDDRGHGLAVLVGLAQPEQWPSIRKVLERSFNASPYMEKYILESLFRMGDANAALTRMKSRYQKMVESPLTTLWEGWGIGPEGYGGGSYNHGWSGGPLTLLMEYVCGVAPIEPGFSRFQVMPQPGSLSMASASFETVKGTIRSSFQKLPSGMEIMVTVPDLTRAVVGVPASGVKSIKLNGKLVWEGGKYIMNIAPLVQLLNDRIGFELAPGDWQFVAEF